MVAPRRPTGDFPYRLIIKDAEPEYVFRYRAELYYNNNQDKSDRVGGTFCFTKLGATIWGRRLARRHRKQQTKLKPFRKEIVFHA